MKDSVTFTHRGKGTILIVATKEKDVKGVSYEVLEKINKGWKHKYWIKER
jgi:hypothetical protein